MAKHPYAITDIEAGSIHTEDGRYRGKVNVKGHKLQSPSAGDCIVTSNESFDSEIAAIKWATDYINRNFPPV